MDIPPGFDGTYYPEGLETVPRRLAILRAGQIAAAEEPVPHRQPRPGGLPDGDGLRPPPGRSGGLIQVTLLKPP